MTNAVIILAVVISTNATTQRLEMKAQVVAPKYGNYVAECSMQGLPRIGDVTNSTYQFGKIHLTSGTNTVSSPVPSMAVYHPDQFRESLRIYPVKESKK